MKNILRKKFDKTSDELLDILECMLQFNPHFRPRADELLKAKIFDEIRVPSLETGAPAKLYLKVDEINAYNFIEFKDNVYPTLEHYRKQIIKEVCKYNKAYKVKDKKEKKLKKD